MCPPATDPSGAVFLCARSGRTLLSPEDLTVEGFGGIVRDWVAASGATDERIAGAGEIAEKYAKLMWLAAPGRRMYLLEDPSDLPILWIECDEAVA